MSSVVYTLVGYVLLGQVMEQYNYLASCLQV